MIEQQQQQQQCMNVTCESCASRVRPGTSSSHQKQHRHPSLANIAADSTKQQHQQQPHCAIISNTVSAHHRRRRQRRVCSSWRWQRGAQFGTLLYALVSIVLHMLALYVLLVNELNPVVMHLIGDYVRVAELFGSSMTTVTTTQHHQQHNHHPHQQQQQQQQQQHHQQSSSRITSQLSKSPARSLYISDKFVASAQLFLAKHLLVPLVLVAASLLLALAFCVTTLFKNGNMANDGLRLGIDLASFERDDHADAHANDHYQQRHSNHQQLHHHHQRRHNKHIHHNYHHNQHHHVKNGSVKLTTIPKNRLGEALL